MGRLLRLAAKELVLQGVDLAARLVKLFLQLLDAFDGLGMLAFPIADFPAKIVAATAPTPAPDAARQDSWCRKPWLRRLAQRFQKRGIHKATL